MSQAARPARGRGAFADDVAPHGLLHARVLRSPHAHARIMAIDASAARALPGVALILTHESVARVVVRSGGPWSDPELADAVLLDRKVRFVGDRVAVVAAEDPEVARRACEAIRVDYEVLPAIPDPEQALAPGAPILHDEDDARGIADASRNIAAEVRAEVGDVAAAFASADRVFESAYRVPAVPACPIERHVAITWLDHDQRLVVRSSTDAPFQVRRILAALLGIPTGWIRVTTPRVGGRLGSKQEVLVEDVAGLLTLRTGRPVRLELTREEELAAASVQPAQTITLKTAVKAGHIAALEMRVLLDTGAHGGHAPALLRSIGAQALALYRCPNLRYEARAAYTSQPAAGGHRGYSAAAAFFALESHVDEVAAALGEDPLEFRRRNHVQDGDESRLAEALGVGSIRCAASGLPAAIEAAAREIGWARRWKAASSTAGPLRRGIGMALAHYAPGLAGGEGGAATLALNEDGSISLVTGPSETGASVEARGLAARVLGVPLERIIAHTADTDGLPFDPGARAPTAYATGRAAEKAARAVLQAIRRVAGPLLATAPEELKAEGGRIVGRDGRSLGFEQVAHAAHRGAERAPIAATALVDAREAPPSFAAVFAEVEVDTETGAVRVLRLVEAVDAAPLGDAKGAEGQIEGDALASLGWTLFERLPRDASAAPAFRSLRDYTLPAAVDAPEILALLPPASSPAKPLGELAAGGVAPAIANAVSHATGVRLRALPLTPDRVLAAIGPGGE